VRISEVRVREGQALDERNGRDAGIRAENNAQRELFEAWKPSGPGVEQATEL
jgi:hypothetical protein